MPEPSRLAPIAHDEKRAADMATFAQRHAGFSASATSRRPQRLGQRILDVSSQFGTRRLQSGLLGAADWQIGAQIAEGKIDVLIFFVDPLTPLPHDIDVKALIRLAIGHDIPMA